MSTRWDIEEKHQMVIESSTYLSPHFDESIDHGEGCVLLLIGVAPKSGASRPNKKEAFFCVYLAQTATGLTGVPPAVDGTTIHVRIRREQR